LFRLSNQRITQYYRQHRIVSIITGHIVVISILTIALFSSSLGAKLNGVFAWASCPAGDQTYSIMSGDTLSGIAASRGTTWQKLAQHNEVSNPSLIYAGRAICLPGAHVAQATSASTPTYETLALTMSTAGSPTSVINEVFGSDAPSAQRIAMCESSLNPSAANSTPIGGSHAEGLFQILYPSTWNTTSQAGASPFNARANAIAAHEIFARDGHSWREWACQP
jgi:LysM repeat protein